MARGVRHCDRQGCMQPLWSQLGKGIRPVSASASAEARPEEGVLVHSAEHDLLRLVRHAGDGRVPVGHRFRLGLEVDHRVYLVNGGCHAPVRDHLGRDLLCPLRSDTHERAQLVKGNVGVDLARAEHVVLDDCPLQDRAPVVKLGHLMRHKLLREPVHLRLLQHALHEGLLEDGEGGEPRAALVLVESREEAGPLRPRGGEDRARRRTGERLHQLRVVHLGARGVALVNLR
mmetsp:Transcript_2239/g.6494  ORF Transcript_2239/g.6494 Transcript_2239/m.6494 type:complete len:231 (-) Transcript_2239:648-1340(-)